MTGNRATSRLALLTCVAVCVVLLFGVILLVAATTAYPRPRRLRTKVWMAKVRLACRAYHEDFGHYPAAASAKGLMRILDLEHQGKGPYLYIREKTREKAALDPWGTRLQYERSPDGQSFRLGSAGLDRKFGTEDDIWLGEPDRAK